MEINRGEKGVYAEVDEGVVGSLQREEEKEKVVVCGSWSLTISFEREREEREARSLP